MLSSPTPHRLSTHSVIRSSTEHYTIILYYIHVHSNILRVGGVSHHKRCGDQSTTHGQSFGNYGRHTEHRHTHTHSHVPTPPTVQQQPNQAGWCNDSIIPHECTRYEVSNWLCRLSMSSAVVDTRNANVQLLIIFSGLPIWDTTYSTHIFSTMECSACLYKTIRGCN